MSTTTNSSPVRVVWPQYRAAARKILQARAVRGERPRVCTRRMCYGPSAPLIGLKTSDWLAGLSHVWIEISERAMESLSGDRQIRQVLTRCFAGHHASTRHERVQQRVRLLRPDSPDRSGDLGLRLTVRQHTAPSRISSLVLIRHQQEYPFPLVPIVRLVDGERFCPLNELIQRGVLVRGAGS